MQFQYLIRLQYAAEKLSDRALGYGIHGEQVDGNDKLAMYKAMKEARDRAISWSRLRLIEAVAKSYDSSFIR
ncbi:thiamine pyrophosphate-dependent enzyme [Staphylococcus aureus]